jgi:hypothetical protein
MWWLEASHGNIEADDGDYCLNKSPWSGEVSSTAGGQWELESISGKDKAFVGSGQSLMDSIFTTGIRIATDLLC